MTQLIAQFSKKPLGFERLFYFELTILLSDARPRRWREGKGARRNARIFGKAGEEQNRGLTQIIVQHHRIRHAVFHTDIYAGEARLTFRFGMYPATTVALACVGQGEIL